MTCLIDGHPYRILINAINYPDVKIIKAPLFSYEGIGDGEWLCGKEETLNLEVEYYHDYEET